MRKRVTAGLMAFLMAWMTVLGVLPAMEVQAAGKTLIIHYGGRADNEYDGWNLWIWEEGKDGQAVEFTDTDDFGLVGIYQTNNTPSSIGFIVRLNEWEAKDVEADRFVTMDSDTVEIWVTSAQEEFSYEVPDGASAYDMAALDEARLGVYDEEDALKLNVHYYDFAGSYDADALELTAWLGSDAGGDYPLTATDAYGALFHVGFQTEDGTETAGIRITADGDTEQAMEYTIDLTQAVDNVLDVYLVEGNQTLWYDEAEVVYTPIISAAAFSEDSSQKIELTLSKALESDNAEAYAFTVTDAEGTQYPVTAVTLTSGKEVTLALEEALALSKTYTVTSEDYEGCQVSMSKLIGSEYFDEELAYDGDDLGATYSKEKTSFRVWAPTAQAVSLNLYEEGDGDNLIETIPMTADVKGTWVCEKAGDLNGVYYTYLVQLGDETNEVVDLYARSTGVNGNRGEILDLDATDPEGFDEDVRPAFENATDAVIYELHIRDLSSDSSSGIEHVGKFLGLTETGTTNSDGLSTGLDHILDLGVTHVQILPSYDYATVDETQLDTAQFNWGYDPKNYNVPEGSYSTDPYHGEVRVNEMKQMIQTLHENGIRVNMDVVYNHTYSLTDSWFQQTVPDYYYRKNGDSYSNGSGCGNETASDRAMMRKYIVDSVVYWATEYHIDGFRFDLMGVHDLETMQAVREALDEIDPSIMVYGEGWTGGDSALDSSESALKENIYQLDRVGAFSDDIRDAIKGNVFDSLDKGFVNGADGMEESIKFGIVAATEHSQVNLAENAKGSSNWSGQPGQSINYVSCHDNLTFWDKLCISNADDSEADRIKMNKLGSAIVLTSQGVPFMQAGEELLRSKPNENSDYGLDANSYASSDATNSIKWDNKGNVLDTYEYYKGLIAFRKAHGALRMTEAADIQNNLTFMDGLGDNVVAYTIEGNIENETAERIAVIFNANTESVDVTLPDGDWDICVNGETAGTTSLGTASGSITVDGITAMVLVQGDDTVVAAQDTADAAQTEDVQQDGGINGGVVTGVIVAIVAAIAAVAAFIFKKRK